MCSIMPEDRIEYMWQWPERLFLEVESSKPKKEEEQDENRMRNIMSLEHELKKKLRDQY